MAVSAVIAGEDHRFPCQTCGSDLRFGPGTDSLVCDHCGAVQSIESIPFRGEAIAELDFRRAAAENLPAGETEDIRVSTCPNCGAMVEFSESSHASECPFCATPVVTGTGLHRHIKPRGLLPFALKEEEARDRLRRWLGSLWFAPGGVQSYARAGRAMNGIYVPFWTYDADTRSAYRGKRGTIYHERQTVTVNVNGRRERREQMVQKIRWTPVAGQVARFFDDVLILASRALPKTYTDGLAPWDLSALEPYRPEYLAGFRAEGYTVSLDEGFEEARGVMNAMIVRDVKFDIGGDRQEIDDLRTEIGAITFKHVLLPVWLAAYKYRGQTYRFVVNGRTGQVQGERPWSVWKITFAVLLGAVLAACAGYVIAMNQR
jgi:ribosomal protein S27E